VGGDGGGGMDRRTDDGSGCSKRELERVGKTSSNSSKAKGETNIIGVWREGERILEIF
jgi:hypothetical protein